MPREVPPPGRHSSGDVVAESQKEAARETFSRHAIRRDFFTGPAHERIDACPQCRIELAIEDEQVGFEVQSEAQRVEIGRASCRERV